MMMTISTGDGLHYWQVMALKFILEQHGDIERSTLAADICQLQSIQTEDDEQELLLRVIGTTADPSQQSLIIAVTATPQGEPAWEITAAPGVDAAKVIETVYGAIMPKEQISTGQAIMQLQFLERFTYKQLDGADGVKMVNLYINNLYVLGRLTPAEDAETYEMLVIQRVQAGSTEVRYDVILAVSDTISHDGKSNGRFNNQSEILGLIDAMHAELLKSEPDSESD